ncbi:Lar family restriction alleviation protein [Enterobacter hormaechei]|nr:Lar family restriction alleviation protein [Enterobacter hormaechei]
MMNVIEIFGEPGDYSGSFDDDGQHMGMTLKPCPFCGSDKELSICNTHTACFWVECYCGAAMHSGLNAWARRSKTEDEARRHFEEAMTWAVNEWNARPD